MVRNREIATLSTTKTSGVLRENLTHEKNAYVDLTHRRVLIRLTQLHAEFEAIGLRKDEH